MFDLENGWVKLKYFELQSLLNLKKKFPAIKPAINNWTCNKIIWTPNNDIFLSEGFLRFKIFGFDSTLVHNSREIKIGLLLLVAAANIFSFVFLGCWHLHGSGLWQHLVRKLESGDPFESSHVLSTQFLPDLNHRLQRIPCCTL